MAQDEPAVQVGRQSNVSLAWGLRNLSVVDGRLCGYCNGMMLAARMVDGRLVSMEPDTLLCRIDDGMNYVVRNGRDGRLYYTVAGKGESRLYAVSDRGDGRTSRISPKRWGDAIEHPAFSSDGSLMVFAARAKGGEGGSDLWGSFWNGERWNRPFNLGPVVNTPGDEVQPVFCGNFLVFVSNGRDSARRQSLYSVSLPTTMGENEIPSYPFRVEVLPEPFNDSASDFEPALSPDGSQGFWVSTRCGSPELFFFKGTLSSVRLYGVVTDAESLPVGGARVSLLSDGCPLSSTLTAADGSYNLLLLPDKEYSVTIEKHGFFRYQRKLHTFTTKNESLVQPVQHDVALRGIPLNRTLRYGQMYGKGGDVELSAKGKSDIMKVITFLRDNPAVTLQVSIYCDPTDDMDFNNMLTDKRISYLEAFLESQLPAETSISLINATRESQIKASGSGNTELMIVLADQ